MSVVDEPPRVAASIHARPIADTSRAPALVFAAVFLLAASGLMFELTLTRIFSATIWYHYTFVAISVALFGWGLGGFLVYLLRLGSRPERIRGILIALTVLLSLALPLFPYAILQRPFTPEALNFYFGISLLPFLAGGAALSLAFEAWGRDSNRMYFADLAGAATGTLLVPLSISLFGAETAVLATAVLAALAGVLFALTRPVESGSRAAPGGKHLGVAAAALVLLLNIGLTAGNYKYEWLAIRDAPQKALYQLLRDHPGAKIDFDKWNAYSRITRVSGFDEFHLARLYIDSDAETSVLPWDGTPEGVPAGRDWFRAIPMRITENPRVLVIGPGGGSDVVLSIVAGSPKVTAVEMNPLIIEAVRELGAEAGNLYDHENVELVMDEGRNFVERTDQKFDLIILGFVDSWASVASGGLSLTENYLYTRDALKAYYNCLTEDGALVIIRWTSDIPRLVANSVDLLTENGVAPGYVSRQIMAVSQHPPRGDEPVQTIFMLARMPLSDEAIDRMLAGHDKIDMIHVPSRKSQPNYERLFTSEITLDEYGQSFDTLATPVTDQHPFYFATQKPYGLPDFVMRLFRIPLLAVVGFTAVLLIAAGRMGFRAPDPRTICYFGGLGVGFIVCEIALMQRLILLLGHPIYTIVVILFTILLAAGLGSVFARRFPPDGIGHALGRIIPAVIVLVVAAAFLVPIIVRVALPLELPLRIALVAAISFPFGFLMGMPFPLGLRWSAAHASGAPVSALWGINGVASVVGSVTAVALAVVAGFTAVFFFGAACYAVAWAARPK